MCGIAGLLAEELRDREGLAELADRMGRTLVHRGPDSGATWVDPDAGLGFAHRRLAVIDPTPDGAQPMVSASGRYVTTYNGEIYNHASLRDELAARGERFRGHCDTEVLLAAVERWGVRGALERTNGMFALALWDRRDRVLHLARDRIGEKPLYFGWCGSTFLFGSELKALHAHPGFRPEIDRGALALFMRHGYVPAPYSIYAGVRKLVPGGLLEVSLDHPGRAVPSRYWSAHEVAARAREAPLVADDAEAIAELEGLLGDAVAIRMNADVPLGAFLSGGIDSSTIVALMQAQSARPIKTYTIGFSDAAFDEAAHAARVAHHLGTEHTELVLEATDAMRVIPKLPSMYDEPFADSSQIPTFLVSQLARRHVTVSLSGDAGDELFSGYDLYRRAARIGRRLRPVPGPLRRLAADALHRVPAHRWRDALGAVERRLPTSMRGRGLGRRIHAFADLLRHADSDRMLYRSFASVWKDPTHLVRGSTEPPTAFTNGDAPAFGSFEERMMFVDVLGYLPDCILAKVDRASMAVSLEARIPLLDHRVVELAWRLPMRLKVRNGVTKWILRQILYRHVPRALVDRPKMGFGVPIGAWLRGPLRDWAEDLLAESRLRREGYLDPRAVRGALNEHVTSGCELTGELWSVLMFESWLAEWGGGRRSFVAPRDLAAGLGAG